MSAPRGDPEAGWGQLGPGGRRGLGPSKGTRVGTSRGLARRKDLEKRWLLENLDGAFLVLDEIVDRG